MTFFGKRKDHLVVHKYGGTSVGSIARLQAAAERVRRAQDSGATVVVVVSAMGGETDRLLALSNAISATPQPRELDALAATGEQVSASLFAMCLAAQGRPARSFLGHQVRILTDRRHGEAGIKRVDRERILNSLAAGETPVVAGFQGVDEDGNITTIGRGGTDTTAVAVAAAIGAGSCEIYTDVDGIYTADPALCPSARKLESIPYRQMLAFASLGSKVLATSSAYLAMKHGLPVHVRSSFVDDPGTWVIEDNGDSAAAIAGIATIKDIVCLRLVDVPGVDPMDIVEALSRRNVRAESFGTSLAGNATTPHGSAIVVKRADLELARAQVIQHVGSDAAVRVESGLAQLTIVGIGTEARAGFRGATLAHLATDGIPSYGTAIAPTGLSVLVASEHLCQAVCVLHDRLGLQHSREPAIGHRTG